MQKDFNIEDEAGGVGKAVIKKFPVAVTNSTLEIRFHWAGKGTTGIPVRGVYGPLISAISVNPGMLYNIIRFFLSLIVCSRCPICHQHCYNLLYDIARQSCSKFNICVSLRF